MLTIDPNALPEDIDQLHKIVVELCERLKHEASEKDKFRSLLRELLDAQRNRKSEQLTKDQLELFGKRLVKRPCASTLKYRFHLISA